MKRKIFLLIILILIVILSLIYLYKPKDIPITNDITKNEITPSLEEENNEYVDTNPIKISLYKYYNRSNPRTILKEYFDNWNYHQDILSLEAFFTTEEEISGSYFQDVFYEYYNTYTNIENYKIGYKISFLTNEMEVNKTILSPNDTTDFFEYLEVYLYDDYHREKGVWYSHTTEEEYNEETLLTSIKLTAGIRVQEIVSDIAVTAFTYDADDFNESGEYKGNSKYTVIVKNGNN